MYTNLIYETKCPFFYGSQTNLCPIVTTPTSLIYFLYSIIYCSYIQRVMDLSSYTVRYKLTVMKILYNIFTCNEGTSQICYYTYNFRQSREIALTTIVFA